jgi:hypothetical protein
VGGSVDGKAVADSGDTVVAAENYGEWSAGRGEEGGEGGEGEEACAALVVWSWERRGAAVAQNLEGLGGNLEEEGELTSGMKRRMVTGRSGMS